MALYGWSRPLDELIARREADFLRRLRQAPPVPLPGVRQTIEGLKAAGLRLAVASSATAAYLEAALAAMRLRKHFQAIVSAGDVEKPKPAPDAYLCAADRLHLAACRCLAFEDSAVGVAAARAAGCFVVGVANPSAAQRQDLSAAHRVVPTMGAFELTWLFVRDPTDMEV